MSDLSKLTQLFKLLGEENRIRILSALSGIELTVGELQKILRLGQSGISTQLSLLKEQGLVIGRKEGQRVFYRLSTQKNAKLKEVLAYLLLTAETAIWFKKDQDELKKTIDLRKASSVSFFNSMDGKGMNVPGHSWKVMAMGLMGLVRDKKIIDLGCGDGELCLSLAEAGNRVCGIDNSKERIKKAEKALAKKGIIKSQVEFIEADMDATGLETQAFDIAILSHSLHHASLPQKVLLEVARLLKHGGVLLLIDLLAHDQEWMKTKFGDFWMGFDFNQLKEWLMASSLKINASKEIEEEDHSLQTVLLWAVKDAI